MKQIRSTDLPQGGIDEVVRPGQSPRGPQTPIQGDLRVAVRWDPGEEEQACTAQQPQTAQPLDMRRRRALHLVLAFGNPVACSGEEKASVHRTNRFFSWLGHNLSLR